MEIADVVAIRSELEKLTMSAYQGDETNKKIQVKVPIWVVCDNSLNILDTGFNTIWDDDKGYLIHFRHNTPGTHFASASQSLTQGDAPAIPMECILVDYGEIQNMRVEVNKEVFEALATAYKMKPEMKEWLYDTFFVKLQAKYSIERRRNLDWQTMRPKDKIESKRTHSDLEEYNSTVQPQSFF